MTDAFMRLAECFHVGVFIFDEMEARGWELEELVCRMGGDEKDRSINHLALEMCLAWGLEHRTGLLLGDDLAKGLERAFGVRASCWLALDAAWQECETHRQAQAAAPCPEEDSV